MWALSSLFSQARTVAKEIIESESSSAINIHSVGDMYRN